MSSDQAPCLHPDSQVGTVDVLSPFMFFQAVPAALRMHWVKKCNPLSPSSKVSFAHPLAVISMSYYYCDYYSLGGTSISRDFEKTHPRGIS